MLQGKNILVLDLETAYSATDDCRHCLRPFAAHFGDGACTAWEGRRPAEHVTQFAPIGWNDHAALGLSVGCYWDYLAERMVWFDIHTLEEVVQHVVARQPLLVSFNGIAFDFPLMRGLLRHEQGVMEYDEHHHATAAWYEKSARLGTLCDAFKAHCAASYDILEQIWRLDPDNRYQKDNSLDAICQASGLGPKLSSGAQAPRDWRDGQFAKVLNYCQDDVYKTKALFEMVCAGQPIIRGNGRPITLPVPAGLEVGHAAARL